MFRTRAISSSVIPRMDNKSCYIDLMRRYRSELRPIPAGVTARGGLRRSVRAVLFDVYGTLFVSGSGDIGRSREQVESGSLSPLLERYRVKRDPDEIIRRYFDEIERVHSVGKEEGVDIPEVEIDKVWMKVLGTGDLETARKFACEFEMIFNPVWPMPYLGDLLRRLREDGRIMGIVSNAQFFTPLLFEMFLGSSLLELGFHPRLVILSFQHGRAKPSIVLFDMVRETLEEMGLDGEEVLYVGNDMLNDVYPAYRSGFQTALFAGDRRSLRLRDDEKCCSGITPELVVTNLEQLSEHIIST